MKMKFRRTLMTLVIAASTLAATASTPDALAGEWQHVRLRSQEGIRISIDYISNYHESHDYKPTNVTDAEPVFVNISGPGLSPSDRIRIVFNSWEYIYTGSDYKQTVPFQYVMDLDYRGSHFSGNLDDATVTRSYLQLGRGSSRRVFVHASGYGGEQYGKQDIAVVINGQWLVNPVNGSHNFDFDMSMGSRD